MGIYVNGNITQTCGQTRSLHDKRVKSIFFVVVSVGSLNLVIYFYHFL